MSDSIPNIALEYLYRDAGNNKRWNTAVFSNPSGLTPEQIQIQLEPHFLSADGNFEAEQWELPTLYHDSYQPELDHGWHEFAGTSRSDKEPQFGDISEFLKRLTMGNGDYPHGTYHQST